MTKKHLILSLLSLALLQACGGGGDGGSTSTSATGGHAGAGAPVSPANPNPPTSAFVATSTAGIALQQGLYAVSYGMGTINSLADKSIWQTKLGRTFGNLQATERSAYAGNAQGGNDVLEEATKDFHTDAQLDTKMLYARFDDQASKLVVGAYGNGAEFLPRFEWGLAVERTDLSGTSIQDFLSSNQSVTKPITDATVAGSFASGSNAIRFTYTAMADHFLFQRESPFVRSQAEFERSGTCAAKTDEPTRLAAFNNLGGTVSIYEIPGDAPCSRDSAASASVLGTGTWTRKTGSSFDYFQIDFPSGVAYSRLDPTFRQSEYDAGVRPVTFTTGRGGRWADGFVVPKGVSFQSRNLALNKVAADSVKTATGL